MFAAIIEAPGSVIASAADKGFYEGKRYAAQYFAHNVLPNVLNHAVWGFPTLTATSSLFGRNRTPLGNNARKVMLGVKYYF